MWEEPLMITFISCRCSTCDVMIIVGFSQTIIVSTIFFSIISPLVPCWNPYAIMLHPFSIMLLKLDEPIPINPLWSPMFSYVLIRINPYVYPYGYGIFHLNSARSHGSHSFPRPSRSRHHGGGDKPGRIQGQNHQRHRPGPLENAVNLGKVVISPWVNGWNMGKIVT